eukprot:436709-Karenia_brevis.AAC.1
MAPELRYRASTAVSVMKPLRKHVLSKPFLPAKARAIQAQAHLMSKLLYNAGSWPTLTISEQRLFHTSIMKVYRSFLPYVESSCRTDAQVICEGQHIPPLGL